MPFLCKYVQCSYNVLRKYVLSDYVVANNVSSLSNSRLLLQVSGNGFLFFFFFKTAEMRDLVTPSPGLDVSIKSLLSELREPCGIGGRKNVRTNENREHQEIKAF